MDQLTKTGSYEANPFRPAPPVEIRNLSGDLYAYLREQAETLRTTHNTNQGGDSTFNWELLTTTESNAGYTLGSLGRFYHPQYGLIIARYVEFAEMDESLWSGAPVGFLKDSAQFSWRVTNRFNRSRADLAVGFCASYSTPASGQFGWTVVSGINVQAVITDVPPVLFSKLAWYADSKVQILSEDSGPPIARVFGTQATLVDGKWHIPPAGCYIESLSLVEATSLSGGGVDVEGAIQQLQQLINSVQISVSADLNAAEVNLTAATDRVNWTANLIGRKIAAVGVDEIRAEIQDSIQLTATAQNLAQVAADNAQTAADQTFTRMTVSNQSSRTASIKADEASYSADSATNSANAAEVSNSAAANSATAAATSESNAHVSETNAGTSATAASNSATSAATSAGTATTQAGVATTQAGLATTQAGNAATSAGNASTSANQASTSATNAAGSASNAASSATTATGAATAATTQAGVATTQAGVATTQAGNAATNASNASTYASNASTSASQASTSATNAGTSATNAANSASAANTSSVNAASSATTATTQAGNAAGSATGAAGSATNAANSATAAAGSATTATNQANAAATSASNASTNATNAGTSASSANTSATNASTSATTATTQAGTATTQAGVATTQAGNAAGSATTAGTQATNAANSATGAAGSATTATTQAGIATTQASNASTSATNASNSATAAGVSAGNASTSATTASTSATTAANSATAALLAAGVEFPTTFAGDSAGYTDNPGIAIAPQMTLGANSSFVTVTGVGRVWQALGTQVIAHIARRALYTNAVFNLQYTARNTTASIRTYLSFRYVVFNGTTNLADLEIERPQLPNDGTWYTSSVLSLTAAAILAAYPTATHIAPYVSSAFGDNNTARVTQVSSIVNRDLTAQTQATNASNSATAAATSASTASTQASNAGTSATSAQTSANTATTQAGNASASATNASTSATNASTYATNAGNSATAASTSATNASTSASNAATNAGNASTYATNASTSATSASGSATAASTSAIQAASAGIGSVNPNPVFASWSGSSTSNPDNWGNPFAGTNVVNRVTGVLSPYALQMTVSSAGTNSYLHMMYPSGTPLEKVTAGYYVLEAEVELVSGTFPGAGIQFSSVDSSNNILTAYTIIFSTDKDITGAVVGSGTVGQIYRFRKPIRVTDATITKGLMVAIANQSSGAAKVIKFHRISMRPASDAEASVMTSSGVVVDVATRLATSNFIVSTVAGSATAALRLESKAIGGVSSSSLALEAEEIQIYNATQGSRELAMKMVSGNVIITGDLDVGKGVRVGTLRIPVALQSFQLQAGDGDVVSFGVDLGRTPQLLFDTDRLAVKTASQTYDVRVTGLTSTGFTMYAKIITPSSSGTYGTAASTDAGAGVTPRYQANKSNAIDAASGYYNFSVSMSLVFSGYVAGEPGSGEAYGAVDCYVRPASGAWTYVGTISQNFISSSNGTLSKTLNGSVYYGGAIGLDASLTEFGVVAASGSVNSFSVSYTGVGTSGSATSATPSGEKVTVTVIPQNV